MGDLRGTPLGRLATLLGIEGQPPEDFGWSEVIDGVEALVALRDELSASLERAQARSCCVYDHERRAPCGEKVAIQQVCERHATMCAMCGKRLSARGVCPTCLDELAAERAAGRPAAPPPAPPPATSTTPSAPPSVRRRSLDDF